MRFTPGPSETLGLEFNPGVHFAPTLVTHPPRHASAPRTYPHPAPTEASTLIKHPPRSG